MVWHITVWTENNLQLLHNHFKNNRIKNFYYKIFSTPKPYALIFSCNAEKLEEILQYNNSDTVLPPNSRLPNSRSLQIHGFVSISRKLLIHGFRSKILPIHGFVSISRKLLIHGLRSKICSLHNSSALPWSQSKQSWCLLNPWIGRKIVN